MIISPQKENGYTAIANEILDALIQYQVPGSQMQCLLAIIRKTYGYNKKSDVISLSTFEKITSMDRRHIHRALNELQKKNLIKIKKRSAKDGTKLTSEYRLNKIYTSWVFVPKKARGSAKDGTKGSAKFGTDKRHIKTYKENNTKERLGKYERAMSIPVNYSFQPEHEKYALSKNLNKTQAVDEFESFKIHFTKTGKKYQNWYSAYQSWIRNAIKWGNVKLNNIIDFEEKTDDQIQAELAEKLL